MGPLAADRTFAVKALQIGVVVGVVDYKGLVAVHAAVHTVLAARGSFRHVAGVSRHRSK